VHQRYRQFGFSDSDGPEVSAFVNVARSAGMSRRAIDLFLERARDRDDSDPGSLQRLLHGVPAPVIQWLHNPHIPRAPNREADAHRLAAIRDIARNDPHKYDSDSWLQEEQHAIIERMNSPAASPSAPADGAGGTVSAGWRCRRCAGIWKPRGIK
jgi:hypothetical protein